MISKREFTERKSKEHTKYGEFIIYKSQEFKRKVTTIRIGYSFEEDIEETPIRGTIKYFAHTMDESEMQAMTDSYKTVKEVKAAIDGGRYIEY